MFFSPRSRVARRRFTRFHVVSRKRLPDYVCPATDGDADERTSSLYIVPPISPDLKPSRLLFFSFSSSFFFLTSSSSSSSRPTGRYVSLYRDCISIAMPPACRFVRPSFHTFSISIPVERTSQGFTFIFWRSPASYTVANTNVLLFWWKRPYSFPSGLSRYHVIQLSDSDRHWTSFPSPSLSSNF